MKFMSISRERRQVLFTLVELLVVIAVIIILISLLLPALGKAKSMGKRSACLNNLKQTGIGIYNYISDYNDFMPPTFMGGTGSGQTFKSIMIAGSPEDDYSKGYIPIKLLDCPADTTRVSSVDFWPYYGGNRNWTSYGYNEPVGGRWVPSKFFDYRRVINFKCPSMNSMMTELEPTSSLYHGVWSASDAGGYSSYIISAPRHGGGVNHLFIDGAAAFRLSGQYLGNMRFDGDQYAHPSWGVVSYNYRP
jgi:type II secretory pathway pseudopilin PulG